MEHRSEDERIRALEAELPMLQKELASLTEAITEIGFQPQGLPVGPTNTPFGMPVLFHSPAIAWPLMTQLPLLASIITLVGKEATGACNTVVFSQKLGKGQYFVSVTNTGECDAAVQVSGASGNPKKAVAGGVGGGHFSVARSGDIKIKCLGGGESCKVRVDLLEVPLGSAKGTWVNTTAKVPHCNATPVIQTLPEGDYHVTVKNTGDRCPVDVRVPGANFPAIPAGGAVGGGTFSVGRGGGEISIKCEGGSGSGPCSVEYTLKRR